jgi:catalase
MTMGSAVETDATLENSPSVLFDGLVLPDGDRAAQILAESGQAHSF